jgi:hypothetical protein
MQATEDPASAGTLTPPPSLFFTVARVRAAAPCSAMALVFYDRCRVPAGPHTLEECLDGWGRRHSLQRTRRSLFVRDEGETRRRKRAELFLFPSFSLSFVFDPRNKRKDKRKNGLRKREKTEGDVEGWCFDLRIRRPKRSGASFWQLLRESWEAGDRCRCLVHLCVFVCLFCFSPPSSLDI